MKLDRFSPRFEIGPRRTFTTAIRSPASARRGRRCPSVALDGAACAALRLPCAARLEGVPHNSLRSLRSLRSDRMRQVSLRSSLRSPPSRLRCSAPQTAPPPATASREFQRCALSNMTPTLQAKGCPGGAGRAYEAPRSAGAMARERSEPRKHFWRILTERSERSELCGTPFRRAARGSRSAAQAAPSSATAGHRLPRCADAGERIAVVKVGTGPRSVVWTPRFSCVTAWAKWKGPRACGC